jgi:hypothetical protein
MSLYILPCRSRKEVNHGYTKEDYLLSLLFFAVFGIGRYVRKGGLRTLYGVLINQMPHGIYGKYHAVFNQRSKTIP